MKSKLPDIGTTIFTVMSKMAADCGAINLSQGFPDFDCPDRLRELVAEHLNGRKNQYPPMAGILPLREQIAAKVHTLYGAQVCPENEVTVTSGATEALFDAIQATVGIGDEVILFDPAYDCYDPAIRLAGATPVRLPLTSPAYEIDFEALASAITPRTRMVMINSPHNPCGSILSRNALDKLAATIRGYDIVVLSDEVYEHMVFDGRGHASVLGHDELRDKSFAVFSFGKTYHATGWKLAYCIAPAGFTAEFRKVHQFVTFTSVSFLQYALADYMRECPQHATELSSFYQAKRDRFCELLAPSRFRFTPSAGTYFQLADYSELSDEDDMSFVTRLTREHGVAAIPLSPFFASPQPESRIIRFCFCKEDATLAAATERLCAL
ncbi:MAG: methionine aminotransferase [Proteobacteria bacterium]|nr:methionine aminotransferase [Pseudomonadota bacterium]MDA0897250.1 methionine aminotransferase [Pseudomonadota bacterium]MDA1245242.1 methionine aminotransferase [Pseudomonadota bacterium]